MDDYDTSFEGYSGPYKPPTKKLLIFCIIPVTIVCCVAGVGTLATGILLLLNPAKLPALLNPRPKFIYEFNEYYKNEWSPILNELDSYNDTNSITVYFKSSSTQTWSKMTDYSAQTFVGAKSDDLIDPEDGDSPPIVDNIQIRNLLCENFHFAEQVEIEVFAEKSTDEKLVNFPPEDTLDIKLEIQGVGESESISIPLLSKQGGFQSQFVSSNGMRFSYDYLSSASFHFSVSPHMEITQSSEADEMYVGVSQLIKTPSQSEFIDIANRTFTLDFVHDKDPRVMVRVLTGGSSVPSGGKTNSERQAIFIVVIVIGGILTLFAAVFAISAVYGAIHLAAKQDDDETGDAEMTQE